MKFWHVVAADKRGAQWRFLVRGEHPPSVFGVARFMKTHGRVIEVSGQTVDATTIDHGTIQIVGEDGSSRRVRGAAPKYSIEGDELD